MSGEKTLFMTHHQRDDGTSQSAVGVPSAIRSIFIAFINL